MNLTLADFPLYNDNHLPVRVPMIRLKDRKTTTLEVQYRDDAPTGKAALVGKFEYLTAHAMYMQFGQCCRRFNAIIDAEPNY